MATSTRPFIKARRTLYRGVRMRSRLEAFAAGWFDSQHIAWAYEPECFADETGQYLPDFRLDIRCCGFDDQRVYVEVKPPGAVTGHLGELLPTMARIWSSDPDAWLAIFSEDDETFHHPLLRRRVGNQTFTWRDTVWARCRRCGTSGLETMHRIEAPFGLEPTWVCPACHVNAGFTLVVPWFSPLAYKRWK